MINKHTEELLKNKKLVIFDLDGTIAKLSVNWKSCREEAKDLLKKKYNFDVPEGFNMEQTEELIIKELNQQAFDDITTLRKRFENKDLTHSIINNNVLEIMKKLKQNNIPMSVCSNNFKESIIYFLKEFNLIDYFDLCVGFDDTFESKPSPKGCQLILNYFNTHPKDTLFIGNNQYTDGGAAEASNIQYLDVKFINPTA